MFLNILITECLEVMVNCSEEGRAVYRGWLLILGCCSYGQQLWRTKNKNWRNFAFPIVSSWTRDLD